MPSIAETFGAEGPITDQGLAEARATVCAGCTHNTPGDWLSFFTVPVATTLRGVLSLIKGQGLATTLDEHLHVCDVCSCPLKLKVHCRLHHITAHMPEDVSRALPPHCWIVREQKPKP